MLSDMGSTRLSSNHVFFVPTAFIHLTPRPSWMEVPLVVPLERIVYRPRNPPPHLGRIFPGSNAPPRNHSMQIPIPVPKPVPFFSIILLLWGIPTLANGAETPTVTIQKEMSHLRNAEPREWSSFPEQPQGQQATLQFKSMTNANPWTLTLRQSDVKETWTVTLNGKPVGQLVRDENDLITDFLIPASTLKDGNNELTIACRANAKPDDIRVGQVMIHPVSPASLRSGATLQLVVANRDNLPIPARITLTNRQGTLIPVGTASGDGLAIRQGVIYTASGDATVAVAPGEYKITAGRGFEYSIASASLSIAEGETAKRTLILERQVDTSNWVACDTHVHTVTHSGHGDCSIQERMATLVGEGIELPIATDHNKQIDYRPIAESVGVTDHFTSVIGNEVTTKHGHFNVFPALAHGKTPDHEQLDWAKLFANIYATPNIRVAILNHARDLHAGFRPFSPRHHLSLTGDNLDDWQQDFNAMELINSGAVQTDPMELFTDWCGLINHGLRVTPVGCSDSHDVSRYIVGQARTYIKTDDRQPGSIKIDEAVDSFLKGQVIVSYGLLMDLKVKLSQDPSGNTYGPGETIQAGSLQEAKEQEGARDSAPDTPRLEVTATVLGPQWVRARSVQLFVNGQPKFTANVTPQNKRGQPLAANLSWTLSATDLPHDAWLTAVAIGDGVSAPHWPTAKPYQPDSATFESRTFSSTGPIWIDVDGDRKFQSPRNYAKQLLSETPKDPKTGKPDLVSLVTVLRDFDSAVVNQTLALLLEQDIEPHLMVKAGLGQRGREFERQWREATRARIEQQE